MFQTSSTMSAFIDPKQTELNDRKAQHRFLHIKLQNLGPVPLWFGSRMKEETGLDMPKINHLACEPAPVLPLEASELNAIDTFIRRYIAGGITEQANEEIVDKRSPFLGRAARPANNDDPFNRRTVSKARGVSGGTGAQTASAVRSFGRLCDAYAKLDKPHGLASRLAEKIGCSPGKLSALASRSFFKDIDGIYNRMTLVFEEQQRRQDEHDGTVTPETENGEMLEDVSVKVNRKGLAWRVAMKSEGVWSCVNKPTRAEAVRHAIAWLSAQCREKTKVDEPDGCVQQ
jgi:hypothetical protein